MESSYRLSLAEAAIEREHTAANAQAPSVWTVVQGIAQKNPIFMEKQYEIF